MTTLEPRARILIVDDRTTNVDILVDLLQAKYELATAYSGEQALELAPAFRPDLILLDNMMPGMNGYETCRRLRAMPEGNCAKVLMVSALAQPAERVEGYAAGADDYIAKPFDHDELLAKIRVYLRLKSAEEIASLRSNLITLLQHETRTPMTVLCGALETLKTCLPEDAFVQQSMGMAEDAAAQLHRLNEQIVLLSRLRSGDGALRPAITDVAMLLRQCAASRAAAAARGGVRLRSIALESAWIQFDAEYAAAVFSELIDNALRYSATGGEVRIEAILDAETVTIRVADTGTGIPADALATIMDEFVVGDIRHHRRGCGLGLAIVRELVHAFAGTIQIESRELQGTTVSIEFPLVADEADSVEPSPVDSSLQAK